MRVIKHYTLPSGASHAGTQQLRFLAELDRKNYRKVGGKAGTMWNSEYVIALILASSNLSDAIPKGWLEPRGKRNKLPVQAPVPTYNTDCPCCPRNTRGAFAKSRLKPWVYVEGSADSGPQQGLADSLVAGKLGICARCHRLKFRAEICKSFWPENCRIEPRVSCPSITGFWTPKSSKYRQRSLFSKAATAQQASENKNTMMMGQNAPLFTRELAGTQRIGRGETVSPLPMTQMACWSCTRARTSLKSMLIASTPTQAMAMRWSQPDPTKPVADGIKALLLALPKDTEHGGKFKYRAGDTDVLGCLCEAVTGKPMGEVISEFIWQPMGAQQDAKLIVDQKRTPMYSGGMSVTLRDAARFGCLWLNHGCSHGKQVGISSISILQHSWSALYNLIGLVHSCLTVSKAGSML
ncbi:hypothetical protein WJX77_006312 [Trebouxia sp. C0004]